MPCELCGKDTDDIVVLPIRKKDGCLNTLTCLSCAEASSAYCKKHERPHLGFQDGTTACINCIEEGVGFFESQEVCNILKDGLRNLEWRKLYTWAAIVGEILGDTPENCILRAIVSKACRLDKGLQEIVNEFIRKGSVNFILG